MVPRLQHALSPPKLLQSISTAMHMAIPEPLDEPIEASQLALAFHHRILLRCQSVQTRGDQGPLLHPNQVTDLTLRIVNPTSDIFTVIAVNCPNLRTLTVYDGVDFQPSHPLEVPCRFAPDWATGLPGLCTIEKFTYIWTLDTPHDHAIEDPGRTRPTTRCASSPRLPPYQPHAFSIDGTKAPNDMLFQFSLQHLLAFKRLSSLSFAHSILIQTTVLVGARRERQSGAGNQAPVG